MSNIDAPRRDVTVLLSYSRKLKFCLRISLADSTYNLTHFYTPTKKILHGVALSLIVIFSIILTVFICFTTELGDIKLFPEISTGSTFIFSFIISGIVVGCALASLLVIQSSRGILTEFGYAVADEVRGISVSEFHVHISRCVKVEIISAINRARRCFILRPEILLVEDAGRVYDSLEDNAERKILVDVERFFAGPHERDAQWRTLGGPRIMFKEAATHEASKLSRRYLLDLPILILLVTSVICGLCSLFFAIFFYSKMLDVESYEILYKSTALLGLIPSIFVVIITCIRLETNRVDERYIRRIMERFVDLASEEFNTQLRQSWRASVLMPVSSVVHSLTQTGKEILKNISNNFLVNSRPGSRQRRDLTSEDKSSLNAPLLSLPTKKDARGVKYEAIPSRVQDNDDDIDENIVDRDFQQVGNAKLFNESDGSYYYEGRSNLSSANGSLNSSQNINNITQ